MKKFIDTISDTMIQDILDAYLETHSVNSVTEKLNLSRFKIKQILQKFNISVDAHRYISASITKTGKFRKTSSEYVQECKKFNLIPLEDYAGVFTDILHKCEICNYTWVTCPDYIIHNKSGCQQCSRKIHNLSQEEYILRLNKICPNLEVIGEYIDSKTKILHRCKTCKYEFLKLPAYHATSMGCRMCYIPQGVFGIKTTIDDIEFDSIFESRCYKELKQIFDENNIIHKKWYNDQYCSDFYIPLLDLWIEVSNLNTVEYLEKIWNKRRLVKNFIFFCKEEQISKYFKEITCE